MGDPCCQRKMQCTRGCGGSAMYACVCLECVQHQAYICQSRGPSVLYMSVPSTDGMGKGRRTAWVQVWVLAPGWHCLARTLISTSVEVRCPWSEKMAVAMWCRWVKRMLESYQGEVERVASGCSTPNCRLSSSFSIATFMAMCLSM